MLLIRFIENSRIIYDFSGLENLAGSCGKRSDPGQHEREILVN